MDIQWWYWVIAGAALILMELVVPSFFIFWFGIGALLVALALWLLPGLSLAAQVILWSGASLVMVALWFKVFAGSRLKTQAGTAQGEVIGEVGLLVSAVAPFQPGRVRFQKPILGSDQWSCMADEAIAAGERVRILAFEGNSVKVARA
ncbi:NfeD family protein [Pseudomonas oligotrophica]|uniref:NfeD family protein n=1 Tax=Pseudomonas oligotrophica TaxID=2912055 RepID=UPI001F1F3D85|nr:NfeD family protein [Pseudomonas oligotrophica]MCF7200468.1 NfeD family protein [Pseudomonas oligotrophica]